MELLAYVRDLVVISLISTIAIGIILVERDKRKRVEQELQTTRNSLKNVCQECIKENNSVHARVAYHHILEEKLTILVMVLLMVMNS